MLPPELYTIIPFGTVAVKGLAELTLLNATRGGKKPLFVLSSSNIELALILFGLSPIFTCALMPLIMAITKQRLKISFFMGLRIFMGQRYWAFRGIYQP